TTPGVAKLVANFLRKRQVEIRATYTFKLGWQFALLEPMDLVTLTIPELGYNQKPVRITAIRESDTGELEMDAEDFPWGTASPTQYPQQVPTAFSPRLNADPGMVNTPIVFEAPYQLSQSGQHELWIAVSGGMITNLLKYSEQLDNAVWLRNSNGVAASTVTPNNQTDPLGGQTADTVAFPATGAGQWAFLQQSFSDIVTVAGKTYTFSVWLKAAAPCVTTLAITDLAGNYAKSVTVNVTTTWTRFSATGTFISSGLVGSPIVLLGNGSSASAATLFAWGAQVEQAINPSNYVATTSAVGAQGNPNWGGCSVWVSQDSIEYKQIGKIYAPARMGVLTGAVAAGTGDPDTVNYFPVDMTMSRGTLLSGTQADADTYRTLCWCDGEFLAHQGANMTMANHYNVGQIPNGTAVYLRRGLFGTSSAAHAVGAQFVRLDDAVFTYEYDPAFIGKPIYLKFTSFNTAGMVEQSSGSVVGYQFIVLGVFSQMERVGKNLLSNPGFEINSVLTPVSTYPTEFPVPMGQRIGDGWSCWNGIGIAPANVTGDTYMTSTLESSTPHSGSRSMIVLNKPGAVLPNDSAYYCMGAISDKIAVNPGESYSFGGYIRLSNDGGLPSGVSLYGVVRLVLYDGQANVLGQITYAGNGGVGNPDPSFVGPASGGVAFGGGYFLQSTYCTIPPTLGTSNARPAYAAVWCTVIVRNASSAGWTMTGLQFDCRFDDIFLYPQWSLAGDEIGKVGSISVAFPNAMSYTSTTSSVTWTWNINLSRTNLAMSVSSFSGSQTINGLSPGTYNFYPYIDEVNGILTMVSTGGVGSPSWAHSGSNVAWSQEQNRSDHFPLSAGPMPATVPTSGTGIGSGGGDGSCLRHDVLVREKTKGVVPVAALAAGDWVQCPVADDTPEGWAEVCEVKKGHTQQEWVHTHFNVGDWLATTPGHPFTLQDGSMRRAALLNLEDEVPCTTGITYPVQHSLESYTAQKVSVTLRSVHHVFYAGMNAPVILQHNLIPPPVS
ncbi:MAG TPA: phage tail protein, partial [Alphaproteobacteria bacterium]|nr:phage tail protein [Alphaproteobacteria bacterium]